MSIVCYRDGVMAADSGAFSGSLVRGSSRKVIKIAPGILAGAVGSASAVQRFLNSNVFFPAPLEFKLREGETFGGIVVMPGGMVTLYNAQGLPYELTEEHGNPAIYAIGAGEDMAMGAMEAGLSAVGAVGVCLRRCSDTRGPIQIISLNDKATTSASIMANVESFKEAA